MSIVIDHWSFVQYADEKSKPFSVITNWNGVAVLWLADIPDLEGRGFEGVFW